jgi:hypothetical protein
MGDFAMISIGPYDYWAIEYGYSPEKDLKPILARVSEPELAYATDEDTIGPDPLARRYDFTARPLDYATGQMDLVKKHRETLISKFVKEGESWARAREGYELTLAIQVRSLNMMAGWVGGAFIRRDKKGDKNDRSPVEVVSAKDQRDALKFLVDSAFVDGSFGLSPELLNRMGYNAFFDDDNEPFSIRFESAWPIHDRIMGIQASVLSMLLNPTTLRRVYDNEFRVPTDGDAFTLAELLETVSRSIWAELDKRPEKKHTARSPMISSLRRNLQQEHLDRLIDLVLSNHRASSATRPIASLAQMQLKETRAKIDEMLNASKDNLDPYTLSHLSDAQTKIAKLLEARYVYPAAR